MLEKLNEAWRRLFPRRNPKIWSDETLVMASVMQEELKRLEGRIRSLEGHKNRADAA